MRAFLLVLTLLVVLPARAEDRIHIYLDAAAARLDSRMQNALAQIQERERRLLALRGYVRAHGHIETRWSWTTQQIEQYYRSPEYLQLRQELDKVKAEFAVRNPGFQLHVNTDVRSLEVQIERWNENASVARAGRALDADVGRELARKVYAEPSDAAVAQFVRFLQSWRPRSPPSLAVPGLSRHGQARAFDFHVQRGPTLVASTQMSDVSSVWDAQGWTLKVQAAVHAASDRFRGPLQTPREPWHYEYRAEGD